eukprot:3886345-Pyramimonas_sp.AAC.1
MGGGGAWERRHWSLRWNSLCDHEPCEVRTVMGGGDAWERRHWGLQWSSIWGHDRVKGVL